MFKSGISAATERRREIEEHPKKTRSWRGEKESVRTVVHVRHIPDLPCGEITIESTSLVKHCTTATKKSPRIKNRFENKDHEEERTLFKNRISAATEMKKGNRKAA